MIDQDLRLRRLRQEAADPEVGLILLDVVLGDGAHADPAGELAPVIASEPAPTARSWIVAVVIGTDEDPQDLAVQIETLERAGARVFRTVTRPCVDRAAGGRRLGTAARGRSLGGPPVPARRRSRAPVAAINVGLESFHESLAAQGAQVGPGGLAAAGGRQREAGRPSWRG